MPPKIEFYDHDSDREIELNTCWEICDSCRGEGYSTLHGMEITVEEWDQDELDEYFHGTTYRTPCLNPDCHDGKTPVPDPDNNLEVSLARYDLHLVREAGYRQEREAERRMGC